MNSLVREKSFGQSYQPTWVDRFGVWLSARQIRKSVGSFKGARIGDFGCGFHAAFVRSILSDVESVRLMDLAIAPDLKQNPKVRVIEARLPDGLSTFEEGSLDVIICNSVLEHLWEPEITIREFHRILRTGGTCLLNVPSWRGKKFLEFSAFKLGLSPAEEMEDHKMYYDVKDFWPLLVKGGFRPSQISCYLHKFGLNTFASCKKL